MPVGGNQLAVVQELERQIEELGRVAESDVARDEIDRLKLQVEAWRQQVTGRSDDPWERVLLARHPQRPYTLDYIHYLFTDFTEYHGDRRFGEDPALIGGLARFDGQTVLVVGHQKGRDTKQKLLRNFGMPKPEGYRKALRLMQMAAKFHRPIITLIDTPGAYPGIGAEERGQAEAIAYNLKEIPKLRVPIVVVVHGEGGSGGALAIAIGDRVMMLENAIYSVISPESCSSILWHNWDHKQEAARLLKLTAQELLRLKLVDQVVPEPKGGAHLNPREAAELLRPALVSALGELNALSPDSLLERRHQQLRRLAAFVTES